MAVMTGVYHMLISLSKVSTSFQNQPTFVTFQSLYVAVVCYTEFIVVAYKSVVLLGTYSAILEVDTSVDLLFIKRKKNQVLIYIGNTVLPNLVQFIPTIIVEWNKNSCSR